MQIKDYYKYYLGCEVHAKEGTMTYTLRQLGDDGNFALFKDKHGNEMWLPPNEWKMCLRRLSSITEEEKLHIVENITHSHIAFSASNVEMLTLFEEDKYLNRSRVMELLPEEFHYLLSRGFWLWDESAFTIGLIIEKK